MKKTLRISLALLLTVLLVPFTSCKKDDPEPDVIASFTSVVDAADYKKVQFTNESTNFSALSWNFGDGSAASAEVNPSHTYAAVGEYTVSLTATSLKGGSTDVFTAKVNIADPNVMLTKLAGESSKKWKLLRDVSTGDYPLEVGPYNRSEIWWAMGRNNDELAIRPCMLNDEWTFHRDGRMIFDDKGDYWAEGSVYPDGANNMCASSSAPMLNKAGQDVSAWASGNHTFELTTGADPKLKVIGNGAFLGLSKVGTDLEYNNPQPFVTYNLVSLYDGSTDTLIVEVNYKFAPGDAAPGGYWRFVLVHYDNPADEPPIPGNLPTPSFTYSVSGLTVTFQNTSTFSTSYLWNFGDGATSTEENPVHTYAQDGIYTVVLTATSENGSRTTQQNITISSSVLTDEILQNGAWKLQLSANSIYVGPGLGSDGWWICPLNFLDGSSTGTDDWSCMMDDEFIFSSGGGYEYKTNGGSRNDGYMGTPNGCWTDAQIAASPGAPFGSCNTHSYAFTPATAEARAIITLTNGPNFAAFLGFMKGYYGGENTNGTLPPNGGFATNRYEVIAYANTGDKEVMIVSVDLTPDHNGGAAWTMVLER
ncbi:MAG: PKD domain-containing protein [Bacteroidetes bacterium]|nr:PKD domain-containing protein [Bacteroidota bacterium]